MSIIPIYVPTADKRSSRDEKAERLAHQLVEVAMQLVQQREPSVLISDDDPKPGEDVIPILTASKRDHYLRFLILFLTSICFITTTLGVLPMPLFKYELNDARFTGSLTINMWSPAVRVVSGDNGNTTSMPGVDVSVYSLSCSAAQGTFIGLTFASALSALMALYSFLAIISLMCRVKDAEKYLLWLLSAALIFCLLVVMMDVCVYWSDMCHRVDVPEVSTSPARMGYNLSTAFSMHLVSCLLAMIATAVTTIISCM